MRKRSWFSLASLLVVFPVVLFGQTAFSVSTDYVIAEKPSDYFVFYHYTELGNNTDDTLQMRWVKTATICDLPGEPGNVWDIGIQDHINFYNPANFLDSAEFYIPPVTGSTDKFLLHLFPNNQPGNLIIKFRLFPVNNPSDTVTVTFDYTATEVTSVSEALFDQYIKISPNPAKDHFSALNLSNKPTSLLVHDASGKLMAEHLLMPGEEHIFPGTAFPSGLYFISMKNPDVSGVKKIVVVK